MMTPAQIISLIRDAFIVLVVGWIGFRIYTDGQNAVRAEQLTELQKQMGEQAKTLNQWHTETTHANTELAASVGRINAAPVVTHDWVRPQSSCPAAKVLPGATAAAGGSPAHGRRDQPVSGTTPDGSQRDQILADWKRTWETRLATWRAEHAQWPQP
jgi:hypothetical protein